MLVVKQKSNKTNSIKVFIPILICIFFACFFYTNNVYASDFNKGASDGFSKKQLTIDVFMITKGKLLNIKASYTTHKIPHDAIINLYQLDKISALNNALNQNCANNFKKVGDKDAVINFAKKWIDNNRDTYEHEIKGINKALQLHINQIPAVVFNDKYIVLGTLDLNRAYESYLDFQRKIIFDEKIQSRRAA